VIGGTVVAEPGNGASGGVAPGGGHGFGTAPVFLASISTILGAILFLRFGYAIGHVGFVGVLGIILLGHLVTVPTAMAIAEIATNRRVEGGGEYFIISRSFGTTIGGSIGISLYLSQAISVAFYMIAFAEAFRPLEGVFLSVLSIPFDPRIVSLPATAALGILVLRRGAALGVQALWVVAAVLGLSLVAFALGGVPDGVDDAGAFLAHVDDPDRFMLVFAIVFPAFTGMTAGVGLSGDLARPSRSIPLGVLSATLTGIVVYVLIAAKFAASAPPEMLANDQFVMGRIALWGPIVPIGLACATLSSAIGSILVAPRTLQALAADGLGPHRMNAALAAGVGPENEPRNATLVTFIFAIVMVAAGNVNIVARIISMFFMVTYGSLCAISFLEHFAARPSYRPVFRSRWYISLIGAVMCLFLMLQMEPLFAVLSLLVMVGLYRVLRAQRGEDDLAAIFTGVMVQTSRYFQTKLQTAALRPRTDEWRPSIIMVNGRTFDRTAPQQLLAWLCYRYGIGTYLHHHPGHLSATTFEESRRIQARLVQTVGARGSAVYVDTMVSPSMRSALAQALQFPGAGGAESNCLLTEFMPEDEPAVRQEVYESIQMAESARVSSLVLRHGGEFFRKRRTIHVWLTWHDQHNANLMILLAYILLGHPTWRRGGITIFAAFPREQVRQQRAQLYEMITSGRIPISPKNLQVIGTDERSDFTRLVEGRSREADLVILGFTPERLEEKGMDLLVRHPSLEDVLFVSAQERIIIE
jgi:amino acid transporter